MDFNQQNKFFYTPKYKGGFQKQRRKFKKTETKEILMRSLRQREYMKIRSEV